jgi:hypothetical protein
LVHGERSNPLLTWAEGRLPGRRARLRNTQDPGVSHDERSVWLPFTVHPRLGVRSGRTDHWAFIAP